MKELKRWLRGGGIASLLVLVGSLTASAQSCVVGGESSKDSRHRKPEVISAAGLRVPEKAWNHYGKAVDAARASRPAEAAREIAKALAVAPAFAEPYVLLAVQELGAGRFEAAIEAALAAQRLDPNASWAGVIVAGAYNGMQRYGEAAASLSKLPKTQADTWQAKYEMARAAVGLRDAAEALRWSALASDAAPANCIDTHILRGDAFLLAHRWSDAVTQLTIYINSAQSQYHRAEVLKVLERTKRQAQEVELRNVASAGDPTP